MARDIYYYSSRKVLINKDNVRALAIFIINNVKAALPVTSAKIVI